METYIAILVLIPLFGFVISLMIPAKSEANISRTALITSGVHFIFSLYFFLWYPPKSGDEVHLNNLRVIQEPSF